MVQRVYLVLSGGVLADKVELRLRFAGLETQLVNEQMDEISDCRVSMHRLSPGEKSRVDLRKSMSFATAVDMQWL